MKYTVIFRKKHGAVFCVQVTLNPDESLLQYLWESYNVREPDLLYIFKGNPERVSLSDLFKGENN